MWILVGQEMAKVLPLAAIRFGVLTTQIARVRTAYEYELAIDVGISITIAQTSEKLAGGRVKIGTLTGTGRGHG
jgi:hypothetical protein